MPRNQELHAIFFSERAVFNNDDGTRVVIGSVEAHDGESITIKGEARERELYRGVEYRFFGQWRNHQKFGRQFWFSSFVAAEPLSRSGTVAYLQRCKGIGQATAVKIWEAYGTDSLATLKAAPQDVAAAIARLKPEVAIEAAEWLEANGYKERVTVELIELLDGRGFPGKIIKRAIEEWGAEAPATIKNNPFTLMQFSGCGFLRCDKFYLDLGKDPAWIGRQALCAWHSIIKSSDGSTWFPESQVRAAVRASIAGVKSDPDRALKHAIEVDGSLALIEYNGQRLIAETAKANKEAAVADMLRDAIAETECRWPAVDSLEGLSDHQREQVAAALASPVSILRGSPGTGKAQPLDAKILTPSGWMLMRDAAKGDDVICGKTGNPIKITDVYPQGEKAIYRVTMSDGSQTECCEEHLWETTTRNQRRHNKPGCVRSLGEIKDTIYRTDNGGPNHAIPMVRGIEFSTECLLPIDPYVLGVFLGDGCFRGGTPGLSNPESFIIKEVEDKLPLSTRLNKDKRCNIDYRVVSSSLANGGRKPNGFVNILRDVGLWGKMSHEKFIPKPYLFAGRKDRLAILNGLLDTDGTCDRHHIEFSTSSEALKDGVVFIVQSLGGTVTVKGRWPKYKYKGENKTGKYSYRVTVKLPSDIQPFRLPRKRDRYIPKTKYQPSRRIASIEFVGVKHAQCISVGSSDGLYVTDDFIVTHNTYSAATIIKAVKTAYGDDAIAVAAPTGKAAVRLTEALNEANVDDAKVTTIHRLLQVNSDKGGFTFLHSATNPLPFRFLIIDESSMIDTDLMFSLLSARAAGTHILFVGDPYQLPPVGHGRPFLDMMAAVPAGELVEIQRNSGQIVKACAEIRDTNRFGGSYQRNIDKGDNLSVWAVNDTAHQISRLSGALDDAGSGMPDFQDGRQLDPIWECQVLVAVNTKSEVSRRELNGRLQDILNPRGAQFEGHPFRIGDKVVCLKNQYLDVINGSENEKAYVANGELGEVVSIEPGKTIVRLFNPDRVVIIPRNASTAAAADSDGSRVKQSANGKQIRTENRDESEDEDKQAGAVGDWDLGYALSVHKSQGSDWPVVIVIIDESAAARRVMTRNWIYTAISRAKHYCLLIGRFETALAACKKDGIAHRRTLLAERLRGDEFAYPVIDIPEPIVLTAEEIDDVFAKV